MAANKEWKGFMLFHSYRSIFEKLNKRGLLGDFVLMLLDYSEYGKEPEIEEGSPLEFVWDYHASYIDIGRAKFEKEESGGQIGGIISTLKRGQMPRDETITDAVSKGNLSRVELLRKGCKPELVNQLIRRAEEVTSLTYDDTEDSFNEGMPFA